MSADEWTILKSYDYVDEEYERDETQSVNIAKIIEFF